MIEGNATRLAGTRCRGSGLLACVAMCVVLLLALSTQASAQAPRPVPESSATSSTPAPQAPPSVAPAAARSIAGNVGVGHLPRDLSPWVDVCLGRHRREGRDARSGLRIARDLDGVARQEHRTVHGNAAGYARALRDLLEARIARRRAPLSRRRRGIAAAFIARSRAWKCSCPPISRGDGIKERICVATRAAGGRGSRAHEQAAQACSPPSARPRPSSACSAPCGAS